VLAGSTSPTARRSHTKFVTPLSHSTWHAPRPEQWFYVIDGELTFWVGGEVSIAPAGSFVFGPKGLAHTFIVSSDEARFLLVAEPAGFEGFTRALGEPAASLEIPPPATEPPDIDGLTHLAATFGIQIVGPPGIPDWWSTRH
jgi:hypothetical protein